MNSLDLQHSPHLEKACEIAGWSYHTVRYNLGLLNAGDIETLTGIVNYLSSQRQFTALDKIEQEQVKKALLAGETVVYRGFSIHLRDAAVMENKYWVAERDTILIYDDQYRHPSALLHIIWLITKDDP